MIDLRSDTVTKPSPEMLQAMMKAEVGDDVFGEDPTVNELESKAAEMFGHEKGLFCPSGTMTNQIAINVHTKPGDEVICHEYSHIYNYEGGGIARNSGCSVKLLKSLNGIMQLSEIEMAINNEHDWLANSSLVSIEDTTNKGGGACYSMDEVRKISEFCKNRGLKFHLDGARVFNALVKTGNNSREYGALFDSVSICLSKGLGAPVGSVLVGSGKLIKEARRVRKVFGGGMRQAGILAAGGIYALEHNVQRLKEDHEKAEKLASVLTSLSFVAAVLPVETNIVIFNLKEISSLHNILDQLKTKGIHATAFGPGQIRLVTHFDVSIEDIARVTEVLKSIHD